MRLAVLILLASTCFAQVQGNRPGVIDSQLDGSEINGGVQGVIPWQENVTTGQTMVFCFNTDPATTFTVSDTLGSSFTTTAHTSTGGSNPLDVWMAYTTLASSGADTITLARTSGTGFAYMIGARASGLGAVDGAVATATAAPPGAIGTIATSKTTTTNGDVLFNCSGGGFNGSHVDSPGNVEMLGAESAASPSIGALMSQYRAGAIGTYTPTHNTWGSGSSRAMQTIAFKPSTILVADTIMPDAGVGVAYSAQLHGYGGSAGLTYACTGLPANGFSLNTATGVISASNPTATTSIGCTVTDGTLTSATDSLVITVGAKLSIPAVRQINNTWSGDNGGGNPFTMNVQCGSVIVLFLRGADTHGTAGFVQSYNGAANFVHDSLGSAVRRSDTQIFGATYWPVPVYIIGPFTSSGSDTITVTNNQSSSSARPASLAVEVTGGNSWDAGGTAESMTNTAALSLAPTFTTVVPNTLLLSLADIGQGSPSISAPFSVVSSGGDIEAVTQYSSAVISTAQGVTATISVTGGNTSAQQNIGLLIPIRPALPVSSCPANFGTGEKIRRQVY